MSDVKVNMFRLLHGSVRRALRGHQCHDIEVIMFQFVSKFHMWTISKKTMPLC